MAFNHLTRAQCIQTANLIHNLSNTNRQNPLYYNSSPLCPGYNTHEEDFEHVLKYPSPDAVIHQQGLLTIFQTTLQKMDTPKQIVTTLLHGFEDWLNPPSNCSRPPTYGSLRGPDIFLADAYCDQFHNITWYQFCLGRISIKWA
jgi:hypothetical protein